MLGVAFAVKFFVLWQISGHPLLQPVAGLDTEAYVELATRVLKGDFGLGPGLYYVSPLYIYFLAVFYGLMDSLKAVQVVQAALGTATVWLVFAMGRAWAGPRAGWLAATLAAGCGVLTFHEIVLMQSALDPFLTACALSSLTMAVRLSPTGRSTMSSRAGWLVLTGMCFGLLALNRPQALLPALVVILLIAATRKMKDAALVAAGVMLAMLPVAARNVVVAGEWSLASSHGGLNFFIGNHEHATGLYTLVPGIRPGIEGQREDTRKVAEAALGRPLSDSEVSDYFFDRGLAWVRAEPMSAARLFAKKLLLAVHADHVALPHSYEFFVDDERTALRWLVFNPWLIMPLGIAGLLFVRPRTSFSDEEGFWIWALFGPAYAIALAVFFLAERYRLPLLVPLCVSAAMFLDWVLLMVFGREQTRRSQLLLIAAAVGVIAVGVNWPFDLADSREGDRLRMVSDAANRHDHAGAQRWASLAAESPRASANIQERLGRIFLASGNYREATRYLTNAVERGVANQEVRVDLAEAQRQMNEVEESLATLQAIDWTGAAASVVLRGGRLAAALGANDLSVTLFARATEADSESADAWAQLGFAQLLSGRTAEAERALLEAVRRKPSDSAVLGGLAICAARLGRVDEARSRANAALRIDPGDPLARQVLAALGGR